MGDFHWPTKWTSTHYACAALRPPPSQNHTPTLNQLHFSTVLVSMDCSRDGQLLTCDNNDVAVAVAREFFTKTPFGEKVHLKQWFSIPCAIRFKKQHTHTHTHTQSQTGRKNASCDDWKRHLYNVKQQAVGGWKRSKAALKEAKSEGTFHVLFQCLVSFPLLSEWLPLLDDCTIHSNFVSR